MKKTIIPMLLAGCILLACDKDDNRSHYGGGGSGGDKVEIPTDVPEQSELAIKDISALNKGSHSVNSHAGMTSRSSLKMNWRTCKLAGKDETSVDVPIYPRVGRTSSGEYQMFYHRREGTSNAGNKVFLMTSPDLYNWTYRTTFNDNSAMTDSHGNANTKGFADTFPLLLANGDMICVTSIRAISTKGGYTYRDNQTDAGLELRRSTDGGTVWQTAASKIFTGVNWEPFMLQLSNGDIHCYFTDSRELLYTYPSTPGEYNFIWGGANAVYNNSGTSLIVSKDNGATWSEAVPVCRTERDRSGSKVLFTDQMPSVIQLNGSTKLAGAFEADKAQGGKSTDYYISFAYSKDNGEWDNLSTGQSGPSDRGNWAFKGCAPYLVQFTSGETVVSYNYNSYFYMKLGDENARNFGGELLALPEKGYFWGSMFVIDDHQLFGSIGGSDKGMQMARFVLNHNIAATRRTPAVDGHGSDWADTDDALFVGSLSQAQATLRVSADNDNVYFLAEVKDEKIATGDYISVFLSSPSSAGINNAVNIQGAVGGLRQERIYRRGAWETSAFGTVMHTGIDGTADNAKDTDTGYVVEFSVPKASLPIVDGKLLLNFAQFDMAAGSEDALCSTSVTNTNQWIELSNL